MSPQSRTNAPAQESKVSAFRFAVMERGNESLYVLAPVDHCFAGLHGAFLRGDIELCGVHCDATRFDCFQGPEHEVDACIQAAQMLEGTRRPREIETA